MHPAWIMIGTGVFWGFLMIYSRTKNIAPVLGGPMVIIAFLIAMSVAGK